MQHGTVYILEIVPPYRHARYYVGWSRYPEARIAHHRKGTGARLTRAAVAAGCELRLVHSFPGTRADERMIHDYKNTARWLKSRLQPAQERD